MKLKLVLIAVFTLNLTLAQNSLKDTINYEITYKYSFQENKLDSVNIQSEEMTLKLSKHFSFYISSNNLKFVNMVSELKKSNSIPVLQSRPKSKFNYTIVKDYKTDKLIFSEGIGQDDYTYNKALDKFNWILHEEVNEILGYKCKKATTTFAGRDYIAWYATEISISDGPYKFHGLPGLIFSIYDTNKHYKFEVSSIKKDNTFFDTKDEFFTPITTTESKFKEIQKRYKEKPSSMMNNGGMTFPQELLDKADQRAKERLKYENNPLELVD